MCVHLSRALLYDWYSRNMNIKIECNLIFNLFRAVPRAEMRHETDNESNGVIVVCVCVCIVVMYLFRE